MANMTNNRSMTEVLQDIVSDVQEIVRSEVRLAQAEIREELSKAAKSSVLLIAGIVFALYAVGFLLLTIVYALETAALPAWLAALIVAAGVTLIAVLLLAVGRKRIKQVHIVPDKTVRTVKENVQWAKQQAR
jgi:uncharacterized membrane protein YqjE